MYCKHCGKQITDDSLYCQFCGGKQDVEESTEKKGDKNVESSVSSEKNNSILLLTPLKNKYLTLYLIWVIINILCWMFGKRSVYYNYDYHSPKEFFFPFTDDNYTYFFDIDFYDGTEFFVYVLLIPLVIYFYLQFSHKPLMQKIKEAKKKNQ